MPRSWLISGLALITAGAALLVTSLNADPPGSAVDLSTIDRTISRLTVPTPGALAGLAGPRPGPRAERRSVWELTFNDPVVTLGVIRYGQEPTRPASIGGDLGWVSVDRYGCTWLIDGVGQARMLVALPGSAPTDGGVQLADGSGTGLFHYSPGDHVTGVAKVVALEDVVVPCNGSKDDIPILVWPTVPEDAALKD